MTTTAHDALSPVPVIGLTGGIGSGKSTAATVFRSLGVPVVDADAISRALTGPGAEGSLAVARRFGEDFLDENRAMNRARMRELVFSNPEARRELEALLHPLIGRNVLRAFSSLSPDTPSLSPDTPYAVFDCPLLLENKTWRGFVSRVLVIDLAEEASVERVVRRSGLAPETVRSILRSQLPRRARLDAADDVVYNGSTPEALADRIKLLHKIYGGK